MKAFFFLQIPYCSSPERQLRKNYFQKLLLLSGFFLGPHNTYARIITYFYSCAAVPVLPLVSICINKAISLLP